MHRQMSFRLQESLAVCCTQSGTHFRVYTNISGIAICTLASHGADNCHMFPELLPEHSLESESIQDILWLISAYLPQCTVHNIHTG